MKNISLRLRSFVFVLCLIIFQVNGQNQNENIGFKAAGYYFFHSGTSLSLSLGYWKTFKGFQPATNLSVNALFGRSHLGNNSRKGTGMQVNFVLSPMVTVGTPHRCGIFEEISPLYLNHSSAVYSNFLSALTLGTSFVTSPKGAGNNYTTSRNRTQQLLFAQLKIGFDPKQNNAVDESFSKFKDDWSFQFNFVEDLAGALPLADNWDRYYTGGGSIQVRWNAGLKLKVISEVYTGTTARDLMDYPDLIRPEDSLSFNLNDRPTLGP